jgi:hypothetical protein
MTNCSASTTLSKTWARPLRSIGPLVITSLLIVSCAGRPVQFFTGQDYLRLKAGETFTAPRDMVLATESVIQEKDAQILDLLAALRKVQAERDLK